MTIPRTGIRAIALLVMLMLWVLAGCADLGRPLLHVPVVELSADTLEFGVVAPQNTVERTLVVGNRGEGVLHADASLVCGDYAIVSGGGAFDVMPGATHAVVVRFRPTVPGPDPCSLRLGDGLPGVFLRGAGAPPVATPGCTLSAGVLDFGPVDVGRLASRTLRVFSTGTAPLHVQPTVGCGVYAVAIGDGPHTIAPGDSLEITVNFAPTAAGVLECTLSLGPECPSVTLHGEGTLISFARDLAPTLVSYNCRVCHDYTFATDLVNVVAVNYGGAYLIAPRDPDHSVLYAKIANLHTYSGTMPPGAGSTGMSAADRTKWFTWIIQGALDN